MHCCGSFSSAVKAVLAGNKRRHVASFAFDTIERRQQFDGRGCRQDQPIRAARLRQLQAGCGVTEIDVHQAVPASEIQIEGVEHPAGPGK